MPEINNLNLFSILSEETLYTVNSRYNRRNAPEIYVCYIVKYVLSSEFLHGLI